MNRDIRRTLAAPRGMTAGKQIGCDGKIGFLSWNAAQAAIIFKRSSMRIRSERKVRTAYRCGHCGKYHVGRTDRQDQINKRRPQHGSDE